MKLLIPIIISIALVGCGMSNQEIVAEATFCTKNGMSVRLMQNEMGRILMVQCVPAKDDQ